MNLMRGSRATRRAQTWSIQLHPVLALGRNIVTESTRRPLTFMMQNIRVEVVEIFVFYLLRRRHWVMEASLAERCASSRGHYMTRRARRLCQGAQMLSKETLPCPIICLVPLSFHGIPKYHCRALPSSSRKICRRQVTRHA
jgi:hypothetical protein